MDPTHKRFQAFLRVIHSFSLKLMLLAGIFLIVPAILYWQFEKAERQQRTLLHNAAGQSGRLIAAMLRPHLEHFQSESPAALNEAVAAAATGGSNIKLLLRPSTEHGGNFFYVASAPAVSPAYFKKEAHDLLASGIFDGLASSCEHSKDLGVRFVNPAGKPEILTSMIPIHVDGNCWAVIVSQNASQFGTKIIGLPFWSATAMQIAVAVYLASALLLIWVFAQMVLNAARFRAAARQIRLRGTGQTSFRELNTIPELAGVAEDFDSLVAALTEFQEFIRKTAEENTHALKAPLAVIAQSIEPLKKVIRDEDVAAKRSLELMERSVARLDTMVSASRDLEKAIADVVYPVSRPINLSKFLSQLVSAYEMALTPQGKRLVSSIEGDVTAYANEDLMEPVIEDLLENAASFTAPGGVIEVRLERDGDVAQITVADRGLGVKEDHLPHIFDRYASYRSAHQAGDQSAASQHQGLGLWIAKRNVEGLGGTIVARNRRGGGFEVTVGLRIRV